MDRHLENELINLVLMVP